MKENYLKTSEEVMNELKTVRTGLSSDEAEKRINQYGKNELEQAKKELNRGRTPARVDD